MCYDEQLFCQCESLMRILKVSKLLKMNKYLYAYILTWYHLFHMTFTTAKKVRLHVGTD